VWNIDLKQTQAGHAKGRSHMREGWQKKEVNKVNIMYFLYKNEFKILNLLKLP
jgi:hypothetical protein